MRPTSTLMAALWLLLQSMAWVALVKADVIYDLSSQSSQGGILNPAFTFYSPGFVTTDIDVFPGPELSCMPTCWYVQIEPVPQNTTMSSDEIGFVVGNGVSSTEVFYYFQDGAFSRPGHYSEIGLVTNGGSLDVIATPEPASAALLILCVVLRCIFRDRRHDAMPLKPGL